MNIIYQSFIKANCPFCLTSSEKELKWQFLLKGQHLFVLHFYIKIA